MENSAPGRLGPGMEAGWSAPPLSQELYASAYALRRSLSSMHDVGMAWVGQRAATIAAAGVGSGGVSVLSVGSGQGDVDVHVIKSILDATRQDGRLLRYVAVDPSHAQCELFRALLQEPPWPDDDAARLALDIREERWPSSKGGATETFDLVLLVHVLYYFEDLSAALAAAHGCTGARRSGVHQVSHPAEE